MNQIKAQMVSAMIDFYRGSTHDIEHFLKVCSYASVIGRLEGLDERTQDILEMTAIVHDISCPLCREKYGNANGKYQEQESEAILRPFLAPFGLPEDMVERIIYLVCHHHTYESVEGLDWQILLEADFLVNARQPSYKAEAIRTFRDTVARTAVGRQFIDNIYLRE